MDRRPGHKALERAGPTAGAVPLCDELAREPINAVYSSGALRCLQSIEPLADRYGLSITVLPGLHETGWLPPPHWRNESFPATDGPLGGAFAAGVGMQALRTIRANHRGGRVAACTHGDILPAIVLFLNGAYELGVPAPNPTRGGWYTLTFDGDATEAHHHDVLPGFPTGEG